MICTTSTYIFIGRRLHQKSWFQKTLQQDFFQRLVCTIHPCPLSTDRSLNVQAFSPTAFSYAFEFNEPRASSLSHVCSSQPLENTSATHEVTRPMSSTESFQPEGVFSKHNMVEEMDNAGYSRLFTSGLALRVSDVSSFDAWACVDAWDRQSQQITRQLGSAYDNLRRVFAWQTWFSQS